VGVSEERATQCASFVWTAARRAKVGLEDELEPSDVRLGAKLDGSEMDGFYFYSANERLAAAHRIYSIVYDMVSKIGGKIGEVAGAPENWANQIANCFASDDCDYNDNDSTAWEDIATIGHTVSPDNILFWDGPYGASEPLAFRIGTFRQVYTWQASEGSGTLTVTVQDTDNKPVAGALVSIGEFDVSTDASGKVTVEPAAGIVTVIASKKIDGRYFSGTGSTTVVADKDAALTVIISPPPESMRSVRVVGSVQITDDEAFDDEHGSVIINQDFLMNPTAKSHEIKFSKCVGGEVRAEGSLTFSLYDDNTVGVSGALRLYEGTNCKTDDLDDFSAGAMTVAVNKTSEFILSTKNDETFGGDTARLDVTITNAQAL
jgi:hypothetical protein